MRLFFCTEMVNMNTIYRENISHLQHMGTDFKAIFIMLEHAVEIFKSISFFHNVRKTFSYRFINVDRTF